MYIWSYLEPIYDFLRLLTIAWSIIQLQEKRENSGSQSAKWRDLQQEASDKIKVRTV